ncbi:hypothetical protein K4K58_003793 [Colletotrichum sp. SAR11_239]|nr:hypothetical protein K4K58_003793 [Colletotrichum sp. SAR11_239]
MWLLWQIFFCISCLSFHFVHTAQRFRNIFICTLILINCVIYSYSIAQFELKPYTDNDDCRPVKQSYLIANWHCALYVKFDHYLISIYDDQHVKQFEFGITRYRCVFLKFNLSAIDKFRFIKQRQFVFD